MALDRFFTADYVERATLRDGTPVLLRLICPEDKELLVTVDTPAEVCDHVLRAKARQREMAV